jgi:MinD superfamily P-loop ATPase
MIITVASGKGGTGKTTIATNLAVAISKPVRLLDCDVEEPNVHLFLKPDRVEVEKVYTMVPAVEESQCTLCGVCSEICQFSAIVQIGNSVMTFPEMCHSCNGCLMACPEQAKTASERQLGEIISGQVRTIELFYGKLKVGEAMSPPLIERVKKHVDPKGITIIDAPPGTSCPVAATLRDSDFVLLVTEPTPFGLNDLKLAVETVRLLNIPMGMVINRSDIGTDATKRYANNQGIPILLEIPHKREIAENYSKGVLMVDAIPLLKKSFENLFSKVSELISQPSPLTKVAI